MDLDMMRKLAKPADTKILLLVMDGLGGLPGDAEDFTALEKARTPNLDSLAADGICGLHEPVGPGITPGSGPAHLALFGYDPLRYQVGRGVLAALGVGFDLRETDVAARGNFCSVDDQGLVTDRRAGRIDTSVGEKLCEKLDRITAPDVEFFVRPVKEYRFLLVLRGENLSGELADTDPQRTGRKPLPPEPLTESLNDPARPTADKVARFIEAARETLRDDHPANMVLTRGFSKRPDWPKFTETFSLRAAAVAAYPMYRGVSRLVGMDALETEDGMAAQIKVMRRHWDDYDFFYFHVKKIDSAGEDGDFDRKVSLIEDVDRHIPEIMKLKPDVVVVTGDHSTPAAIAAHGWHPVPALIWSRHCRRDNVRKFGERACMAGGLGPRLPGCALMPIAMANAGRLDKFGA